MSRTPGRRTDRPDDEPTLQVDELGIFDIGQRLVELGKQLQNAGTHFETPVIRDNLFVLEKTGDDDVRDVLDEQVHEAIRRTLRDLREFRRSYDYWERVIAEFALKFGFTQREAALALGVSTATINRWAQHPVEVPIRD